MRLERINGAKALLLALGIALLQQGPLVSTAGAQSLPEAVVTEKEIVVTANPLATEAGAKVLKRGGTAVDAMVAVQTVLGLVEPQSSGLGGGAFVVYYDAKSDELTTIDARETAPASAASERFLDDAGESIGFFNAWQSGLSVGVPGVPRMMEYMHERYGRLPWRKLFLPAARLASDGFELTERTSTQVAGLLALNPEDGPRLFFRDSTSFEYFVDADGTAKPAGTVVRNMPYAKTLAELAWHGADAFYNGDIAVAIVEAIATDPNIPGDMTVGDLADYQVIEREPVCVDYRGFDVCGMGPPSSGGIAVGQILGILRPFDLSALEPVSVEAAHLFSQAGRLAFADRNLYVADSDFVSVPVAGLLDDDYLASRSSLIDLNQDLGPADPGVPPGVDPSGAAHNRAKTSGTSHVSIVDRYGNALSMTTTIESSLGNGVMVRGFLLNNELTDFSFRPADDDGNPIANRVEPGKRPRSSMSPTIIFDTHGDVSILTGSPGGSRIIGYTAQSIINMIDFGLDSQEAINIPHYGNRNGNTELEEAVPGVTGPGDAVSLQAGLEALGHPVSVRALTSGLSIIQITDDGLVGGADKRRDGAVGGR
ncbi:MAG: gamma-glutamyltransferase [Geminicoccales bacterium]